MSLSLRERGLKFPRYSVAGWLETVALLARAWIEILLPFVCLRNTQVALLARAWIEMCKLVFQFFLDVVALLARAWIEMPWVLTRLV